MQIVQCYCDACHEVIKDGEKKYYMICYPFEQYGKTNYKTVYEKIKDGEASAKHSAFELCVNCKNILEYLFLMKKVERKKLLNQIEIMYSKKYPKNRNGDK